MQVYDISAEDGAKPSFEFVQSSQYWEVPIAGQGQPENPVPAADGSTYQVHSYLVVIGLLYKAHPSGCRHKLYSC